MDLREKNAEIRSNFGAIFSHALLRVRDAMVEAECPLTEQQMSVMWSLHEARLDIFDAMDEGSD